MGEKPNPSHPFDLLKIGKGFKVDLKSHELPQELESRLRQEEADAAHQRLKDLVLFFSAITGVTLVAVLCAVVSLRPSSTADDKKWAAAVLSSIVSAAVGFLVGKNWR